MLPDEPGDRHRLDAGLGAEVARDLVGDRQSDDLAPFCPRHRRHRGQHRRLAGARHPLDRDHTVAARQHQSGRRLLARAQPPQPGVACRALSPDRGIVAGNRRCDAVAGGFFGQDRPLGGQRAFGRQQGSGTCRVDQAARRQLPNTRLDVPRLYRAAVAECRSQQVEPVERRLALAEIAQPRRNRLRSGKRRRGQPSRTLGNQRVELVRNQPQRIDEDATLLRDPADAGEQPRPYRLARVRPRLCGSDQPGRGEPDAVGNRLAVGQRGCPPSAASISRARLENARMMSRPTPLISNWPSTGLCPGTVS